MRTLTPPKGSLKSLKQRQLLSNAAQDELKAYIIDNGLKPGAPLPTEADLAQQLNISRNILREAVKSLQALGIIESRQGAGLFVRKFSFDPIIDNLAYGMLVDLKELSDLLEVRQILEVGMAERVMRALTPDQLARLREVVEQMKEATERGRYVAEHDRTFHLILYEELGNSVMQKVVDVFWVALEQAQERGAVPTPAGVVDTYQRHLVLLEALEARDLPALQEALRGHAVSL